MRLEGKRILIVGAGTGVGRASAYLMAKEGASLFLVSRSEKAYETAKFLTDRGHVAFATGADASNRGDVKRLIAEAKDRLGGIDVAFINAGYWAGGPLEDMEEDDINALIEGNLLTHIYTAHELLPYFADSGGGVLIHTAAVYGPFGVASHAAVYNATKAAVVALVKSIARDYAKYNIRANAICPNGLSRRMYSSYDDFRTEPSTLRRGWPEDVAYLAVYLASDESWWMNGSAIAIDGGWSVRARE
ncbi:MAG: SDR family oxidoreductase [Thermotogae bacterium]|nr:SDR family oxidoreductase [Thermotogota bacterium]